MQLWCGMHGTGIHGRCVRAFRSEVDPLRYPSALHVRGALCGTTRPRGEFCPSHVFNLIYVSDSCSVTFRRRGHRVLGSVMDPYRHTYHYIPGIEPYSSMCSSSCHGSCLAHQSSRASSSRSSPASCVYLCPCATARRVGGAVASRYYRPCATASAACCCHLYCDAANPRGFRSTYILRA